MRIIRGIGNLGVPNGYSHWRGCHETQHTGKTAQALGTAGPSVLPGHPDSWFLLKKKGKLKPPGHLHGKRTRDEPSGEVVLHTEEQRRGYLNPAEMPSSLEDIFCNA